MLAEIFVQKLDGALDTLVVSDLLIAVLSHGLENTGHFHFRPPGYCAIDPEGWINRNLSQALNLIACI